MTRSPRSTKFLLITLIASLGAPLCGSVDNYVVANNLNLQLVPQKTSCLTKAANAVSGLFWTAAATGSFVAVFDAFMNTTKNSKLVQGGLGATAFLVSLYKLGFFEPSDDYDDSCDCCDNACGCGCHSCYDSCHDCSCHDGSCCHDAFCHDYYEERTDQYGYPYGNTGNVTTVTVETVSNDVMCNAALTDIWEDPFNY